VGRVGADLPRYRFARDTCMGVGQKKTEALNPGQLSYGLDAKSLPPPKEVMYLVRSVCLSVCLSVG